MRVQVQKHLARLMARIPYALLQTGLCAKAQLAVREPDTQEPKPEANSLYQTHRHVRHGELISG